MPNLNDKTLLNIYNKLNLESKMKSKLFKEFTRVRQNMLIPAEEALQWARSALHFKKKHNIK